MKTYTVNCIEKSSLSIGLYDNPIWNNAIILTDFCSPWDDLVPGKVEFRALWDQQTIYFSFKVYDRKIHIDNNDNSNESIGNSDRVEVFFREDKTLDPYYCLEIDPSSRIMDFIARPQKVFDFDWKWSEKDLKVKSDIKDDFFVVEIAITVSSLKALNLIKDNKIEAGLFRAKYNENQNLEFEPTWITWVNPSTESPNFHISSSFGILDLVLPQ